MNSPGSLTTNPANASQDQIAQETGGPAFPVPNDAAVNGDHGMTLRDYFAGQALAGWIATITDEEARSYDGEPVAFREHQDAVAATCYGYADAMLRART